MNTMIRDPENNSDLDDGIYFNKEDLTDGIHGELSAEKTKELVCGALNAGILDFPPEIHGNCVRISFKDGNTIDLPIFRKIEKNSVTMFEFASKSHWELSNAMDVANWYKKVCLDSGHSEQFHRLTRYLKKFAKIHKNKSAEMLSGFGITVLLDGIVSLYPGRDDLALFQTMCNIERRLENSTIILNPIKNGNKVISGENDPCVNNFSKHISNAIHKLFPLKNPDCGKKTALKCWDQVFHTKFFSEFDTRV